MGKQSSTNTRWKIRFLSSSESPDACYLTSDGGVSFSFCQWAGNAPVLFTRRHHAVLFTCFLFAAITLVSSPIAGAIDCFKCVSLNGNNPSCEDPFHNNYSASILESPCMGGRKGRNGVFPATACIKIAGKYPDTGESLMVRTCAVDSGSITVDTELARISHCGSFIFDGSGAKTLAADSIFECITTPKYIKGCLQSCEDADGCNSSNRPKLFISFYFFVTFPLFGLSHLLFRL